MTPMPMNPGGIQEMERNLATLDPIIQDFCHQHGYSFSSFIGVWPRRKAWRRDEVDRSIDLTMDLTVPEFLERGFYSEMPWSLRIAASTLTIDLNATRILTRDVFHGRQFSSLSLSLAQALELAVTTLKSFTVETVNQNGKTPDAKD